MLLRRLISKQKLSRYKYNVTCIKHNLYSTKQEISPDVIETPELRLSEPKKKMRKREPFAKNFFLAKYDIEFAAFPEPQTHDRHREFFEWLKPIEDYVESSIDAAEIDETRKISPHILEQLLSLEVFRAAVPDQYNGLGLNYSEYAKLIETLSRIPALGVYFAKRAMSIDFISANASDKQKELFLPQIASGKVIPTMCISEDVEGSKGSSIFTKATPSSCNKYWILNGAKTYVVNANSANLFIVFADCGMSNSPDGPSEKISAFCVESSSPGITIEPPAETLGLRGLPLCKVYFKDIKVPAENMIGEVGTAEKLFEKIFSNGKQNIGAEAIGLTKQYLEILIRQMKSDKDFNAVEFQSDNIQGVIGRICCLIYGMESVLYLTTGLMDTVNNQDCALENCIVELYCTNACIQSLLEGIHILGISSQLEKGGVERMIRDAVSLLSTDGTKANLHTYIALMGLQHYGRSHGNVIRQLRNPLEFPLVKIKKTLFSERLKKLYISDNLHPSFKEAADLVELGINNLKLAVELILIRHGSLVSNQHMELRKITDAIAHLYVIAASIARASRSYCLGMRNAECELKIASLLAYTSYQKVKELISELSDGNEVNGEIFLKEIADRTFENNIYFPAHPLTRNF